jgi:DMSO/TMAO reductase YedYZ heme-binding membrane subunit
MTAIDLASFAGLTAMVLLTFNVLLGLLVTTNYNPRRDWPHRKPPAPLFRIHNWTAYVAIAVALLHPVILLFVREPRFALADLLFPIHSPGQRNYNILGVCTLYVIALVVVTSYFRPKLRHRRWKRLHWFAYLGAALMFLHGTLIDPNLKNQPTDFLDGEKVLVEICALLVLAGSIWRWRRGKERQGWARAKALPVRYSVE